jgi:pimeloyl-ACP methyl ester carboxylesterase
MRWHFVSLGFAFLSACSTLPPAPGRLVDVTGHKMHIYCTGPESASPTVIVDGGLSSVVPFYAWLQKDLERQTRICTYDRAGLGWSESASTPREAKQIASELHTLLSSANVRGPFVLAGHSLGGLVVLRYTHDYPEDVAGLALLDSSHPDQYSLSTDSLQSEKNSIAFYKRARIGAALGILYVYNPLLSSSWYKELPLDAQEQLKYFSRQSSMYKTTIGELEGFRPSFAQAAEVKTLGDLPLVVVTAGKQYLGDSKSSPEDKEKWARRAAGWDNLQEQFATLSTHGRHVSIPTADHMS